MVIADAWYFPLGPPVHDTLAAGYVSSGTSEAYYLHQNEAEYSGLLVAVQVYVTVAGTMNVLVSSQLKGSVQLPCIFMRLKCNIF